MMVHGRCLCGDVSFEADVEPNRAFICHCTDCQTQSGTAFRTVVLAHPDAFRLLSGSVKTYERRGDSGNTRVLAFCGRCGTSLYGGPPVGEAGTLSVRTGVLEERSKLRPVAQLWCRSAQPWVPDLETVPKIAEQIR